MKAKIKAFLVKVLIDTILEALLMALEDMVIRSDNGVDNRIVKVLRDSKDEIKERMIEKANG